ncbi:MAG: serine/threonine protein kinase [Ignavibacteriae bacterium]|nr:serine/threonine protein kinase [Ignavibacteriota bacterium]NOG99833.1 serine/threonine protein kinase [Ignavibacteriota bacterium]
MDQERWLKVQELFDKAFEMDAEQRLNYLNEKCGSDKDLFNEVMSLLDADVNAHSIFDEDERKRISEFEEPDYIGKKIGVYKVLRKIASGGMGTVYYAERDDGTFERKVALKLIKGGINSIQIVRRFQRERQILARLHHPNIARLLDGGLTEDRNPYFSMEYVDGKPIIEYCDDNNLNINQRLKIFQKVCAAVQYAHNNLVVHRDLKPNNIYVTNDGVVKLLDFGIAKVFSSEDDSSDISQITQTGFKIMTPEYAAPEQIRGEPVTTSTDIYALGLVLFKLLVGAFPYDKPTTSVLDLEKSIVTDQAQKPSNILKRKTHESRAEDDISGVERISKLRNTSPEKLRKLLVGDLDNICLMALRKEQERRYSSVEQFSQDISNYLNNLPVVARQDTISYRAQKFFNRHKVSVVAAAAAAILIIFITTFYTLKLADERDKARVEAEKAEQVASFLVDLFENSDPSQSKGEDITARELLEAGAKKIDEELVDQPVVKAAILDVIGGVYESLGSYDKSLNMYQNSLEIRRYLFGEQGLEVAESYSNIGNLSRLRGEYSYADSVYRLSLSIYSEDDYSDKEKSASAITGLAFVINDLGKYEEADSLYRIGLQLQEQVLGKNHPDVGVTLTNMALVQHEMGNYQESEELYKRAVKIHRETLGPIHPELSNTLYNYALLLKDLSKLDEAEKLHREVLAADRKLFGEEHPNVAYSLRGLAHILEITNRKDEAIEMMEEVLRIRIKLLGEDHPDVGQGLKSLGRVEHSINNFKKAEELYKDALKIFIDTGGKENPNVAQTIGNLGWLYFDKGEYQKSENYLDSAYKMKKKIYGYDHFSTAIAILQLSRTYNALGKKEEAFNFAEEAIRIGIDELTEDHTFTTSCMNNLASILSEQGNFLKADSLYKKSISINSKLVGESHPRTLSSVLGYSKLLMKQSKNDDAEKLLLKNLEIQKNEKNNSNGVDRVSARLVELYKSWGKPKLAELHHTESLNK